MPLRFCRLEVKLEQLVAMMKNSFRLCCDCLNGRAVFLTFVLLLIPQTLVVCDIPNLNDSQSTFVSDSSEGPVFGNYSIDLTSTFYNQCTPRVYIDVYDPDGVDAVWSSYKRANETSWKNQSMNLHPPGEGNTYRSRFTVNVSRAETWFDVQFFANDTLGHMSSSSVYPLKILYNKPDYPGPSEFPWFLVVQVLVVIFPLGLYLLWTRLRPSDQPKNTYRLD